MKFIEYTRHEDDSDMKTIRISGEAWDATIEGGSIGRAVVPEVAILFKKLLFTIAVKYIVKQRTEKT